MNHKLNALLIAMLVPLISFTQVNFQKTSVSTIINILPFYSQNLINATRVANFPFTRPTIQQGGVPTTLNIDKNYDNLDDTTYERNPIFDFGRVINTNLTLANGNWQATNQGSVWCLKISIDNALNTSLHFSQFSLSPTANFYILNSEVNMLKGPYAKGVIPISGIFGTFPMNGQACYLLLQETNMNNVSQNAITISEVVAGVQTLGDDPPASNNARVSNDCVPSIRCYDEWMTTARAVSRWSNGVGLCSGTLLNNEKLDGTSYYYSAHHCLPANRLNLTLASFQFQFWQSGCNTNIDLKGIEFYGATLLHDVGYNDGDAILLRLNSGPGVGDGVAYAGWSRQDGKPSQSNSSIIHHPDGGDMRFTKTNYVRNFLWDNDFWKTSYSTGVMIGGSSGSALLNENQQVIGTLSRGLSSCFWNFLGDRFGKFHQGWSGMQQYLSPAQNNFAIGSLSLYQLKIVGAAALNCSSGSQQYSVPNLAGCNYTWTKSDNLTIQSGQNTNSVMVRYAGSNQPVDIGWVNVVINDSKGSIPDGRRLELRQELYTGNTITGVVMQSGFNNKPMTTANSIVPNISAHTEFTSYYTTSTSAQLVAGSPANWTFYNYGNYGHLYVTLPNYQSATFDISTTTANCGVFKKSVTYIGISSGGWRFAATPNPATTIITIQPVKDQINSYDMNTKAKDVEYTINVIDFKTGIRVKQQKVTKGKINFAINVANLKRGHYVLQIKEGSNTTTQHIILE